MAVWFTLPITFNPPDFLASPRLQMKADDARWFVSTIVRKTANRDMDAYGCVRLHWDVLRKVMDKHTLKDVADALVSGGAIETVPPYRGTRATGYRLAVRYLSDRHVRVPATDPSLIRRFDQERRALHKKQQHRRKPIHNLLDAEQQHLAVTGDVDLLLDHLPTHTRLCQDVLVGNIRSREFPFSVSSTGRAFNAITGVKRQLRPTLRLRQHSLGSVDIRCAQPALLGMLIHSMSPSSGLKGWDTYKHTGRSSCVSPACLLPGSSLPWSFFGPDCQVFQDESSEGVLYETLASECDLDREQVKHRFLVDVLAKRGRYPSPVERVFRAGFPTVYGFIRAVNRDDHGALIRILQRMESWLVVETVAPRLVGRVPVLTLHDAIYCPASDVSKVREAFEQTFSELGYRLSLKTEIEGDCRGN